MIAKLYPGVKEALRQKRLKARGRTLRLPRSPKPIPPKPVERFYFRELVPLVEEMEEITHEKLFPKIPSIIESSKALRPDRLDDYSDDVERIMREMKMEFYQEYSEAEMRIIAARVARRTNEFNERQIDRSFKKVLGVDIFKSEPWLAQEMKAFTKENVALIKTVPEEYFGRIEKIVMRGVRAGTRHEEIAQEIEEKTEPWAEARIEFIARDQVAKFNGDLTRLRQTNSGITHYIWSTSHDERVRDTHKDNDGKKFAWSDPPEETGHPGEDFQCRCVAIAVFEDDEEATAA